MSAAPLSLSTDPQRDLVIERVIQASPSLVWRLLTEPRHLKEWWAPKPWKTAQCDVDLRPGGVFHFVLHSPDDSQTSDNLCCFLEIVHEHRLVWTNAMMPAFRPVAGPGFIPLFSAITTLQPEGTGTRYAVRVLHSDESGRARHIELGFYDGWGTVINQMASRAEGIAAGREVRA